MSRILVTGAAGFIGSQLSISLLKRGDEVIGVDNFDDFYDPAIKRGNVASLEASSRFKLAQGDIRDVALIDRLLADGVDTIVHLAARAGVRPSIEQPLLYQDVNDGATMVLLDAAHRHEVKKFVMASSSSVYGNNRKIPFAETDNVDFPISPYAATKRACELLAHSYAHLYGMPITCLRFFTVYGPAQRPDLAIHKFTRLIEAGQPIPVFGDGSTQRDYTYIDDIVAGVISAIERCAGYHIYNLGGSQPVSLSELIEAIESALGKNARIERLPMQPGDVERTFADLTLAHRDLGFSPSTGLVEGLSRFVAWFRARHA